MVVNPGHLPAFVDGEGEVRGLFGECDCPDIVNEQGKSSTYIEQERFT